MTSRAPRSVAAIVAKLSTCASSGSTHATGTPERVTIADIFALVRALNSWSNFRNASAATGIRLPPEWRAMRPSLFSTCCADGCLGWGSRGATVFLSDGAHTVRVRAVDVARNSADSSVDITIETNAFSLGGPYGGLPFRRGGSAASPPARLAGVPAAVQPVPL